MGIEAYPVFLWNLNFFKSSNQLHFGNLNVVVCICILLRQFFRPLKLLEWNYYVSVFLDPNLRSTYPYLPVSMILPPSTDDGVRGTSGESRIVIIPPEFNSLYPSVYAAATPAVAAPLAASELPKVPTI